MPTRASGRAARTYGIVRALAAGGPVDLLHTGFGADAPDPAYEAVEGLRLHAVSSSRGARRGLAWARARATGAPRAVARGVSPDLTAAAERLAAAPGRERVVAEDPDGRGVAAAAGAAAAGDLQRQQPRVGLPARARSRLGLAPAPGGVRAAPAGGRRRDVDAEQGRLRWCARARARRRHQLRPERRRRRRHRRSPGARRPAGGPAGGQLRLRAEPRGPRLPARGGDAARVGVGPAGAADRGRGGYEPAAGADPRVAVLGFVDRLDPSTRAPLARWCPC